MVRLKRLDVVLEPHGHGNDQLLLLCYHVSVKLNNYLKPKLVVLLYSHYTGNGQSYTNSMIHDT